MADASTLYFTSPTAVAGTTAGIVLAAFLVNRFAPRKRKHVRRAATVVLLYLLAFAVWISLVGLHLDGPSSVAREVVEVFGALSLVNVGALVLLDLGLPAIGAEPPQFITDLAVGVGYIASVLVTLHRAGLDLSSIVATSALITTITAFSLQGTLSNVVGGVALQVDGSIRVGDWVQLESGKQGRVKEIRWRYTVVETRDWDTMIVPNATLLSGTIIILGKREGEPLQHRMWIYFNVDFRYSPTDVIRTVEDALHGGAIEGVAEKPAPNCICMDFAKDGRDSFAYYAVRYWLSDLASDDPTSSRVRARIFAALKRAGIPLAVPAAHLWVEADNAEHRERKKQVETARRIAALRAVDILKPLHPEEIEAIAAGLRYAIFAPNETITRQGAVAHWLYIVMDGTVEVKVKVEGKERVVARITAPGFFGEMGLMTGEQRMATVTADTEVECYRLDKETFHRIMTDRPEIAAEMTPLLAHRRVELLAARDDLDAEARAACMVAEQSRILGTIQRFFGLVDDEQAA